MYFPPGSVQAVDIIRERITVKEVVIGVDNMVRLDAAVHVIIGAILQEGDPFGSGNLEAGSPGGGHGLDYAATAAGYAAQ